MKTLRFSLHLLVVALVLLVFSSVASAQATRTWVSGVGDDANPCSRTAPCKTFAGAISKTAVGGQVECRAPGGFGAVAISKSILIDCDAGPGGVLVSGTNGIIISGGSTVTLRSLNIDGLGTGLSGVLINSSSPVTVHLIDMNIEGFMTAGINVTAPANVTLTVEDCRIHESVEGIQTNAGGAFLITADDSHVSLYNNTDGVNAQNGSRVQIHNSSIVSNSNGINQTGAGAQGSVVTVYNDAFTGNGTALRSAGGASIATSTSIFSTNSNVFNSAGGSLFSPGDNILNGNAAIGAVTSAAGAGTTTGTVTKI